MYSTAALLGVVQGLTEFLPVSSSAHLILARAFFGWNGEQFGLPFDVACHLGTLLSLLVYFRQDLFRMLAAAPRMLRPSGDARARVARSVVLGTVPVVIAGLTLHRLEDELRTPFVAGLTLAMGGVLLLLADRMSSRRRDEAELGDGEAIGLGVAQSTALVPGVSRSGATITVGLFMGLTREAAARFSFLLGVPAIGAAAAYEGLKLLHEPMPTETLLLFLVGLSVSALVGYATIRFFLRYLASHSLAVFAWYRLALAAAVVAWSLGR